MKIFKSLTLCIVFLSSSVLLADKPSWAGNGGKPSKYEKEEHKKAMTSKKEDKNYKKDTQYKNSDRDYNRERNHRDVQYEGQGQTDSEYIEQKTDETKKNWIGKFFDFLN